MNELDESFAASSDSKQGKAPLPALGLLDAVAIIVGIVIGVGIFQTPSLVAANVNNSGMALGLWFLGGVISFVGALCFAELATAYPHPGGSYYYLQRAFGSWISFLFAWSRLTVVQTGSIALLAFVFGDYTAQIWGFGNRSSSIYACVAIVVLTGLNIAGITQGKWTQNWLTAIKILGLILVTIVGLGLAFRFTPAQATSIEPSSNDLNLGLGLVFVLLSYGGWNEAAFISADLKNAQRNMVRSLMWSIGIITAIYLLINLAYIQGLGIAGMEASKAVAADLMRRAFGEPGAAFISSLIAISALGALNATIFTGGRSSYALGRDFPLFSFLGGLGNRTNTPINAYIVQGTFALGLVILGTLTRKGFESMVDYTAPVFWFFFLLSGLSLIVLRIREKAVDRAFRVPFYPITPILFCMTCAYLLYSSLAYTGVGSLFGVGVVLTGIPLLFISSRR
ncbi:amino acid permease [Mastigocoleus sp. MO_188.B34]|uniref:APC family permease n=1 Tax=Mastigocoleus sp. MO_188.B34 TaxID=3036635 RepID=UPI00262B4FA0|nr:amino acid permease [Mastigocoleus sp. MO_188.B34]MDJ0694343.1 amino acid permease [Mastigocoleus sp. MO_188.B34]